MSDQISLLNLNTASREELLALPGVNPTLADRILAARPFAAVEDLRQVKGLNARLYKRIAPFVTALPAEPPAALPEEIPQPVEALPEEEAPPVIEPPLEAAPPAVEPAVLPQPAAPPPPAAEAAPARSRRAPAYVTRGQGFWMMLVSALVSFALAVVSVLLLLSLLNGGLYYARPADLSQLASQVEGLNTDASDLQASLDALSTRLDDRAGPPGQVTQMAGQVTGLEDQATDLEDQVTDLSNATEAWELQLDAVNLLVDDLSGQVAAISTQAETLSLQVDALLTRTGRFQAFLDGLSTLLDNLAVPDGAPAPYNNPYPYPYPAP